MLRKLEFIKDQRRAEKELKNTIAIRNINKILQGMKNSILQLKTEKVKANVKKSVVKRITSLSL